MKYLKKSLPLVLAFLLGVGSVGLYRTYFLNKWYNAVVVEPVAQGACVIQKSSDGHSANGVFSSFIVCMDGTVIGIPKVY